MKHTIFCFLVVLLPVMAFAQTVGIQVVDENDQPMPYAFVIVNEKTGIVADTAGRITLDVSKYAKTDTVRVSYLGTKGFAASVREIAALGDPCILKLEYEDSSLGAVIVYGGDARRKFFRETNITQKMLYSRTMTARFDARLGNRVFTGDLTSETRFVRDTGLYTTRMEIRTNSDTTSISRYLENILFDNLESMKFLVDQPRMRNQKSWFDGTVYYTYLGEEDGIKRFKIAYSHSNTRHFYHLIVTIDSHTKDAIAIEHEGMNEANGVRMYMQCLVEPFVLQRRRHGPPVLAAREFHSRVVFEEGEEYTVDLYDMDYRYLKPPKEGKIK